MNTENTAAKQNNSAAGAITAASLIAILTLSLAYSLTGNTINEIVGQFGLSGTSEGLMGSMMSVGFMLSMVAIPMVQGRLKKIPALIAACAAQAICLIMSGASPNFAIFCTMFVFLGLCSGFLDTYANSCIVDARGKESPRYLGYLHGLFGVGSLIAPVLILWMLSQTSWRIVYWIISAASLLAALAALLLTRRQSSSGSIHATTSEKLFSFEDLKGYMLQRRGIAILLASFFSSVPQAGFLMWIMRYMTVSYGDASLGTVALTVYWVCATFNRFVLSKIVSKAPMLFVIIGAVLATVAIIIGILTESALVMCIMSGFVGLGTGHFVPVLVSESAKGYEGKTTFTTTVIMFVMGISRIITPLIMAYISVAISMNISMAVPAVGAFLVALAGWMALKADKGRAT